MIRAPSKYAAAVMKDRRRAAERLPASDDGQWLTRNVDGLSFKDIEVFRQVGLVERVGHEQDNAGSHLYQTVFDVDAWLEQHLSDTTPCGCSTGIRTVEAGETFTCRNPDCEERFGRDVARRLIA